MTAFFDIHAAMDTRLSTMTGVPRIAWDNMTFVPEVGETFLRPTILPTETFTSSIGTAGTDEHAGIYQIDVFARANTGRKAAENMADLVADRFAPLTELTYNSQLVRIIQVSRGAAVTADGWYQVPVFVRYLALLDRR